VTRYLILEEGSFPTAVIHKGRSYKGWCLDRVAGGNFQQWPEPIAKGSARYMRHINRGVSGIQKIGKSWGGKSDKYAMIPAINTSIISD
jgi:hypothetical protein